MSPSVEFDEKLWFTMVSHCPGKHYLIGNPHTFNGRMWAWCPSKQVSFFVSKLAMDDLSIEAQYWVKGFLTGNEPEPPVNEYGDKDFDSPQYQLWLEATKLFAETGYWNPERQCESCGDELLPSRIEDFCEKCSQVNKR